MYAHNVEIHPVKLRYWTSNVNVTRVLLAQFGVRVGLIYIVFGQVPGVDDLPRSNM